MRKEDSFFRRLSLFENVTRPNLHTDWCIHLSNKSSELLMYETCMVSTFSAVAKQPCSRITCTVLFFIHLTLLPLLVAFLFLVFQELMRCVLCGGPTKNSV